MLPWENDAIDCNGGDARRFEGFFKILGSDIACCKDAGGARSTIGTVYRVRLVGAGAARHAPIYRVKAMSIIAYRAGTSAQATASAYAAYAAYAAVTAVAAPLYAGVDETILVILGIDALVALVAGVARRT